MNYDFEVVDSRRNRGEVEPSGKNPIKLNTRMQDAIADNFGNILELAANIVEIEKMKVQTDDVIRQMEEKRKDMVAEAESYAKRKNSDTDSVIQKMQMVRDMMRDFYQYNNNANLSGEDFSRIISGIVSEMGRL